MNWKYTLFVLFIALGIFNHATAQELLSVKKSHFVDTVPARKAGFSKIKEALKKYDKGLGFVSESLNLFLEAHALNQNNPELNYNIGICYLVAGPKNKALPFLLAAEAVNPDISNEIHFYIGLGYKYQNRFSKAIVHFKMNNELIEQNNYKEQKELIPIGEKHMQECRNGRSFQDNSSGLSVELLNSKVNSIFDEFNPQVFDRELYFSSRRGVDKEDDRSPIDQKYFEKLFRAEKLENTWGNVEREKNNLGANVNATLLCNFTENQFIFYNSKEGVGDLEFAQKSKGKWMVGKSVKFINKKDSRETSASMSEAGNEIYFVSNREGGFGECDIFYCSLEDNGRWSKPINIGGDINTEFDEGDVYVSRNGKTLYFSSKGHNTMGGYDIFKCERGENGVWGSPINVGIPINSAENDITYSENADGVFYFASDRSDGNGGYDIYRQKGLDPVMEEKIIEEPIVEVVKDTLKSELPELKAPQLVVPITVPIIEVAKVPEELTKEPMKQELVEEDFVYRVQIAASRKEMSTKELFGRYKGGDVVEHLFVENWHKYTIGEFLTFKEAAKYRDTCGVKDAFVVLFKGGYRLGMARLPAGIN